MAFLLPYQAKIVAEATKPAAKTVLVASRQIGKSFMAATTACCNTQRRLSKTLIGSASERQAAHLLQKVKGVSALCVHLGVKGLKAVRNNEHEVRFANKGSILSFSSNADTQVGFTGNQIFDEFALLKDQKAVFDKTLPSTLHGGNYFVCSTPRGKNSFFADLVATGASKGFNVYKLPFAECAPDLFDMLRKRNPEFPHKTVDDFINSVKATCSCEEAWQQEFCCEFVDTVDSFFTVAPTLLQVSEIGMAEVLKGAIKSQVFSYYAGLDIGNGKDSSALAVVRKNEVHGTFELFTLEIRNKTKEELVFALKKLFVDGTDYTKFYCPLTYDASGLGSLLQEDLVDVWKDTVLPFIFTSASKRVVLNRLKYLLEKPTTVVFSEDEQLKDDLYYELLAFKQHESGAIDYDRSKFSKTHGDRTCACALAVNHLTL